MLIEQRSFERLETARHISSMDLVGSSKVPISLKGAGSRSPE